MDTNYIENNSNNKKIVTLILSILIIVTIIILCLASVFAYKTSYATNSNMTGEVLAVNNIRGENIGPVLDYLKDGISGIMTVDNPDSSVTNISVTLEISNISDNLKDESFKYAILTSSDETFTNCSSVTNATYSDCEVVDKGDFTIASNDQTIILATGIQIPQEEEIYVKAIFYIDGTEENNPNLMGNELSGKLYINDTSNFKVTYDCSTNGGICNGTTVAYLNTGESVDLTKTATKEDYEFVGWNISSSATDKISSYVIDNDNITLYAIYKKDITASFAYYNNLITTVKGTVYNNDSNVSITAPNELGTPTDYQFRGWSKNSSANASIDLAPQNSISLSSNTIYYASYTYDITLSFNGNGGTGTVDNITKTGYLNYAGNTIEQEFQLPENTFVKTGYVFNGWYSDSNLTTKIGDPGDSYKITESTTLYAGWNDSDAPTAEFILPESNEEILKATSQIVTLSCTDNIGVVGYYFGTSAPDTSSSYENIDSTTSMSIDKTVSSAGTYYLSCKDASGNISTSATQVYYSYTVKSMLLNVTGTSGTYTTGNYTEVETITNTYLAPENTQITFADVYIVPLGASTSTFKAASVGDASTTAPTTTYQNYVSLDGNRTYSIWFDRNTYDITVTSGTGGTNKVTSENNTTGVTASEGGSTTLSGVRYGETITATATASSNYAFNSFSGLSTSTTNPTTITITAAGTITASFAEAVVPVASITTTSDIKATSQTATLTCTDNVGVVGYYWGTSAPSTSSSYTEITSTTSMSINKTVSSIGTYYLSCKDAAGNVSTNATQIYYSYTVNNMLLNVTGTSETYTTDNYTQASTYTYMAPSGIQITFKSMYTIPEGASASTYKGSSVGAASTTAPTTIYQNYANLVGNRIYSIWFDRTTYDITVTSGTGGTNKVTSQNNTTGVTASEGGSTTLSGVRYGETITATATASSGYAFSGFSGLSTSTTSPISITINSSGTITANFNIYETEAPVASITTTSDIKATSQTATLTCTDNVGVVGYYWGTSAPSTSSSYTEITSTTSMSINKTVSSNATYYLSCKDASGNTSESVSQTYYQYIVNNMLLKSDGTSEVYTTDNYAQASTYTYIAPSGIQITFKSMYTIPEGASASTYKGSSVGAPSTTAPTTIYQNYANLVGNRTYSIWFDRATTYAHTLSSVSTCTTDSSAYDSYYETYYTTLSDAVSNTPSGRIICVLEDTSETTNATVSNNKTLTINFNGYTIDESSNEDTAITVSAGTTLTLTGSGGINATSYTTKHLIINAGGTLNVGTSSSDALVINRTKATSHSTDDYYIISTNSTSYTTAITNINGGTITGNDRIIFTNAGQLNISGGTIENTRDASTSYDSDTGCAISYTLIQYADASSGTISGGTMTYTNQDVCSRALFLNNEFTGTVNITGGTLTGYVQSKSSVDNVLILGSNDGTVSTSPVIDASSAVTGDYKRRAIIWEDGDDVSLTFKYYDGTLKTKVFPTYVSGSTATTPSGYYPSTTGTSTYTTVLKAASDLTYGIVASSKASCPSLTTTSTTGSYLVFTTAALGTAITYSSAGYTICVLNNVTQSAATTVSKNLTLNLNGKTITLGGRINLTAGSFNLINTSTTAGGLSPSGAVQIFNLSSSGSLYVDAANTINMDSRTYAAVAIANSGTGVIAIDGKVNLNADQANAIQSTSTGNIYIGYNYGANSTSSTSARVNVNYCNVTDYTTCASSNTIRVTGASNIYVKYANIRQYGEESANTGFVITHSGTSGTIYLYVPAYILQNANSKYAIVATAGANINISDPDNYYSSFYTATSDSSIMSWTVYGKYYGIYITGGGKMTMSGGIVRTGGSASANGAIYINGSSATSSFSGGWIYNGGSCDGIKLINSSALFTSSSDNSVGVSIYSAKGRGLNFESTNSNSLGLVSGYFISYNTSTPIAGIRIAGESAYTVAINTTSYPRHHYVSTYIYSHMSNALVVNGNGTVSIGATTWKSSSSYPQWNNSTTYHEYGPVFMTKGTGSSSGRVYNIYCNSESTCKLYNAKFYYNTSDYVKVSANLTKKYTNTTTSSSVSFNFGASYSWHKFASSATDTTYLTCNSSTTTSNAKKFW